MRNSISSQSKVLQGIQVVDRGLNRRVCTRACARHVRTTIVPRARARALSGPAPCLCLPLGSRAPVSLSPLGSRLSQDPTLALNSHTLITVGELSAPALGLGVPRASRESEAPTSYNAPL